MSVTAPGANSGVPVSEGRYVVANASGTALEVNPGDYVAWSGQYAIAVNTGVASWKASGIGIAIMRNPLTDNAGRVIPNTALVVARYGLFRVSANFSGQPLLGTLAGPVTTGSGVGASTGVTGVAALWNTATPVRSLPQAITYNYRDLASAISAYVDSSASGSALLPGSGLLSASTVSAAVNGVAQVVGWYNSGPAGTGQMDIALWDRNADYY